MITNKQDAARPTLESLAASGSNPWSCPKCGCDDWRTLDSYRCKKDGMRHRRQYCRHCQYVRMTYESPTRP